MKAIEYVKEEENLYRLMYAKKPMATFKGGIFTYESSAYDEMQIKLNEQLIVTNKTIYA